MIHKTFDIAESALAATALEAKHGDVEGF